MNTELRTSAVEDKDVNFDVDFAEIVGDYLTPDVEAQAQYPI